jgi:GNAT superfamily N-acetyltransferase
MVYWVVSQNPTPIVLSLLTHKFQVLHPDNPEAGELLSLHLSKNPDEATALQNSAGSAPRTFHPVGHISPNFDDEPDLVDHTKGLFCISEFFISHQLQGSGVGKAAMNALEDIAKAPPINAKILSLRCRSTLTEKSELEGVYREIGQEIPMDVEGWYKKRGYEVVRTKEEGLKHDGFEREYKFKWSYMRKTLKGGA